MNREIQQRLGWVKLYEKYQDAGFVCRRCGISRPTLRKWWRRYQESGLAGLKSLSRRRHNSLQLSIATIHKVLTQNNVKPVKKFRRKKDFIRYERPTPGDRVQMDTCKIGPGLYQYTAVDDCTRYRVLRLYKLRTAKNTLDFLECVMEEMPFPIQRFQTDRGREFFAEKVQKKFMEYGIKFRPNKPGSPHLNGKVERSQKTDKAEFYATVNLDDPNLSEELAYWQQYYNWERPHSAHHGKPPIDKYFELIEQTPLSEDVLDDYFPEAERIQNANYKLGLELQKLKGCP